MTGAGTASRRKVAILGGGMAGVTAAWRLSEPGWQDRFDSITIYQRGGRLGGKGASSRGVNSRIEEHGLHVWLGHYDNAFRLLRQVYAVLDRERTDPDCPIRTVGEALSPVTEIGAEHYDGERWHHWIGHFDRNDLVPGDLGAAEVDFGAVEMVRRVLRLVTNFYSSLDVDHPGNRTGSAGVFITPGPTSPSASVTPGQFAASGAISAVIEAIGLVSAGLGGVQRLTSALGLDRLVGLLDDVLRQLRDSLRRGLGDDRHALHTWQLISVVLAQTRGILADGLLGDPSRFRSINDLDFREWVTKHGADPEAVDSTFVLALYSLVFGYAGGDPARPGFAAGVGTVLANKTFFDYRGAIFWKMTAGMGDVVFAPLHQALRQRGVRIEYFSRVDELHLSQDGSVIESVSIPRQVALADGCDQYDPLVRYGGLPCYPAQLRAEQLADASGIEQHDLESFWCEWPDADSRVLHRGVDFDDVVFAIPPAMARATCQELIADSSAWRDMLDSVAAVDTQALQLWLRVDEPRLGWNDPGITMTNYVQPFDTWSSMPQLLGVEQWPTDDLPRTIAYFCNTLQTPEEVDGTDMTYPRRRFAEVRANAERFIRADLAHLLPGIVDDEGEVVWDLLCGAGDRVGAERLDSQFIRANVDPSDRYVQSLPGTDRYRLTPDGSGYANLYLAGDWTDNGINAGCIEAAVVSGLRAANAVMGRPLRDGTTGHYLD